MCASEQRNAPPGFVRDTWITILDAYRASALDLHPRYSRCIEYLWTDISTHQMSAVLCANREMFADEAILFQRMCSIAREEACGASLLTWAGQRCDGSLTQLLAKHSKDESRHCRIYLAAAGLVDPSQRRTRPRHLEVDPSEEIPPHAGPEHVAGLIASMHVAEVRNMMNLTLYLQCIAECSRSYGGRMQTLLRSVAADELWHVNYTAKLVNAWLYSGTIQENDFEQTVHGYARFWQGDVERIEQWSRQ